MPGAAGQGAGEDNHGLAQGPGDRWPSGARPGGPRGAHAWSNSGISTASSRALPQGR
uniref:Predicted protein n=1 Tax=Hordeum vulgare subsp. vulgare TaxID=112509 RepID=F2D562_HORVV|nr:predicted protein [Hordeum vulgare subsp. vulgare]